MSVVLIKIDGQILDACLLEHGMYRFHAISQIAHRVVFAGGNQDGKVFGDLIHILLLAVVAHHVKQGEKAVEGEEEGASGIAVILPDNIHIFGQPTQLRLSARPIKFLIGLPEGEGGDELTPVLPAFELRHNGADHLCHSAGGGRDKSRTGEDAPCQPLAVDGEVFPQQVRTHAVAQNEVGEIGIFLFRPPAQLLHILHQYIAWVIGGEIAPLLLTGDRGPVPQMVMTDHDKALLCHKRGKRVVPINVLHHTVYQLQNSPRRAAFRRQLYCVDGSFAVGGQKCKLAFHVRMPPLPYPGFVVLFLFYAR